ncbi:TlpA family protein disulfide reductase [Pseudonocardia spinosispora]|uniref:TlpA family protein disulfide reductase n=1 Tax=Pseudonocardia spinosispora TaxID=103441 RepID=UPI000419FB15|nr:TlpA disulfide reductase family protein [Pseudonocardia spinosispora]
MTSRTGLTRGELLGTVVLVGLVVVAVLALWPYGGSSSEPSASPTAEQWDDAALAQSRREAALPPCPRSAGLAAPGPLVGVRVPCLGEPGTVEPAAAFVGKDVLINVWASWCAPCRGELPVLAEYAQRPGSVTVLGVDSNDKPGAALALLTALKVKLPVVGDPDNAFTAALRVPPGLPVSYLLRADGSVAMVTPPVPFRSADEVASAVERLRPVSR